MDLIKNEDISTLRESKRLQERRAKWEELLNRKKIGDDVQQELDDFLRNKEEVYLFYAELMTNADRLAAVLDALETQADLLTDLTIIIADSVNPSLTEAQQAAVQAIKDQLLPLRAIELSETTENYRFMNLLMQKELTRNLQVEYFMMKEAKPE